MDVLSHYILSSITMCNTIGFCPTPEVILSSFLQACLLIFCPYCSVLLYLSYEHVFQAFLFFDMHFCMSVMWSFLSPDNVEWNHVICAPQLTTSIWYFISSSSSLKYCGYVNWWHFWKDKVFHLIARMMNLRNHILKKKSKAALWILLHKWYQI